MHLEVAFERLATMAATLPNATDDFHWLKQGGEFPSYDNLAFSYHGNVFAVKLFERSNNGETPLTAEEITNLRDYAQANRLVPCCFPIDAETHAPIEEGWNLLSLQDGTPIAPAALPAAPDAALSEWELLSLRTMAVVHWLQQSRRGEIQNVCTLPGAAPQIFFQDGEGNRAWAIVQDHDTTPDLKALLKEYPALQDGDGYLGVVTLTPPGGTNALLRTRLPEIRGDFDGLKRIYLAPTSRLVTAADDEDLLGQPPPELPAQAPIHVIIQTITLDKAGHLFVSSIAKPVLDSIEFT